MRSCETELVIRCKVASVGCLVRFLPRSRSSKCEKRYRKESKKRKQEGNLKRNAPEQTIPEDNNTIVQMRFMINSTFDSVAE